MLGFGACVRKKWDFMRDGSLSLKFRRRRMEFFKEFIKSLPRPVRVLDVGGSVEFWERTGFLPGNTLRITVLNLSSVEPKYPSVTCVVGDARDMRMFSDKEFDVVFSNSMIEHIPSSDGQRKAAAEMLRVGKRFFIQTPNRNFPIEPHFLIPFFPFLPLFLKVFFAQYSTWLWGGRRSSKTEARSHVESIRPLSKKELLAMFPQASLYTEKFFGLTKSFVAYGHSNAGPAD
ncbi:Methyltransferase domain protein [uncultured archaeon]|nr:Methyltransferase domain protein [uncultured archaeon]